MGSRGSDRRRSGGGRERPAYGRLKQNQAAREIEFVEVPKDLKSRVIGKSGRMIKEIMKSSGALISSGKVHERDEWFTVSGDAEQRACAKRLILEKVQEIQRKKYEGAPLGELVEIPSKYKGLVIGKGGDNLRDITTQTGAKVTSKEGEVYIVSGTEEERQQAKVHIKIIVAGARLRGFEKEFIKLCVFIDDWNLPKDCELKLEHAEQGDRMVHPGWQAQYRLKPAEHYEPQASSSSSEDPTYLSKLMSDTLESLRKLKQEMKMKEYLKADMWCHFGKVIIRGADEADVNEGEWSIDEATKMFVSANEGHFWKTAFNAGVNVDEKILEGVSCQKTSEESDLDYVARYDLEYLTPCGNEIRFKVWTTEKNVCKKLGDIPIPFNDVKNILDEIHFEDEVTRSCCRGWLVLPSRKYLQADILFPGCEFDCRLTIRGRTDSALITDYVPKEESRQTLSRYLSKLTFSEDGLKICLPEENTPEGFHLIHNRCSKRSMYEISPGYPIILSKESSWETDMLTEKTRESTDVHLHCDEWDTLLSSGVWEPEDIVQKLPEFFEFVKKVQGTVFHEMERAVLTKTIPPEILARGPSALEAYKKAISYGETSVKRFPLMLIGQDRAGKTSLKKSLKGICFNPDEDSTVGIDVDPSHFKVSTETWRTGTINQDQNCDANISYDYHTGLIMGKQIVGSAREVRKSTDMETETDESQYNFDSELNDVPSKPRPTESSKDAAEHIQTSRDPEPTPSRHEPHVSADPTEDSQEVVNFSIANVPEEVAAVAESLLRGDLDDSREDIFSTVWDFAGQSVYYETHPLFLTAKAIYCLVYDLSLNPHDIATPMVKQGVYKEKQESSNLKTNLDYLDFWMRSIASVANCLEKNIDVSRKSEVLPEKFPPVFLVCTHADTPYDRRNPRKLSREIFGFLKSKPYGVHLFDVFFVDNTSLKVNNTDCPEVVRLRQQILAVAKNLPHINEAIPLKWLKFEKMLQAVKKTGYKCISLETAENIASQVCNIDEDKEFTTLMNYLHDLRCLIHFDDTIELKKLIVLNPQWLVDVFKKVITIKPYNEGERQFLELWRKLENEGILDEKLLAHVWGPLFSAKETSENLIEIMNKFSLLCPWPSDISSDKSYLVPSMLKSYPPKKIIQLTASAKIPSLFINFANGQVPPAFFPRLVLQFFEWGNEKLWRAGKPHLFRHFARFFTTKDLPLFNR